MIRRMIEFVHHGRCFAITHPKSIPSLVPEAGAMTCSRFHTRNSAGSGPKIHAAIEDSSEIDSFQ
jgi:hypothetical protein